MAGSQKSTPDRSGEATPRARRSFWRRPLGIAVIVACAFFIVFVAGSLVMARATESNKFCGTDCHEMWPYRDSWAVSSHKDVDCVTCHIPPGVFSFIKTKLAASREVWVHFTGQVKAPIAVTRHIPNRVCEASGCHDQGQLAKPISLGTPAPVGFNHSGHADKLCIDCHSQVVHKDIPNVAFVPPNSMAACFKCHNDGPTNCSYCHKAPHVDRGPCSDCHSMQSWGPKDFKHPQPLVGKHAQIACEVCHTQGTAVKPDGCIDCHGDHHNGLSNCVDCHQLSGWTPSTFQHPQEGPHVPRGEEPLQCTACHANGFGQPPGCPCHGGNPPTGGG
jgi:nitrate/TMAO reductase-like tetraheme cytochrome c subunit